jgi:RNA polymerase sigma-70 factor, ECF subfamily
VTLASESPMLTSNAGGGGAIAAFEERYREHAPFVWRNALRLGVRSDAMDDVVQEVFIIVFRNAEGFQGRSQLRTWIYGILRNVVRDHMRQRSRVSDRGDELDESLVDPSMGPQQSYERKESVELVARLLAELEDDKRDVFVLAELEELPMPEIAEQLGINQNTGYARLRAARQIINEAAVRLRAQIERTKRASLTPTQPASAKLQEREG